MAASFQTIFDLTSHPDAIRPAYWFMAIFVTAGIGLAALAWLVIRKGWRWHRSLLLFAAAWIGISGYAIATDVRDTAFIREAVRSGYIEKTEGCLTYFRPGSSTGTKTVAGHEEWSVNGLVFSYGSGEVRPAFHSVSTAGSPLRGDSRVRVFFVVSPAYGRREIVKLELSPHACRMARLVDAFDQP